MLLWVHDFHRVPVIGEFFAAVQADNVGAGLAGRRSAVLNGLAADREAVVPMSATEEHVPQPGEHFVTPGRQLFNSKPNHPSLALI